MHRILSLAAAASLLAATPAAALPTDPQERAVVCYVYGAWAPNDPRSEAAKAAIEATIDEALAAGVLTPDELNDKFSETASLALYEEPRSELFANWNACREAFAPV